MRWATLVFTIPSTVLAGIVIGGGLGYFLDVRLHTAPWLMVILAVLGLVGTFRDALLSVPKSSRPKRSGDG